MIRPATIADAQRIAEIDIAGERFAYQKIVPKNILDEMLNLEDRTSRVQRWITEKFFSVYVYEDNESGIIKGMMGFGECGDSDKSDAFELHFIYMDPAFSRQGIGGQLIDFFESGQTGFLLILETNQERSNNFYGSVLAELTNTSTRSQTYAYTHNAEGGDQLAEAYAVSMTLGDTESAPALLYVRNGEIHDRLDSIYDSSILNTFIAKYRSAAIRR